MTYSKELVELGYRCGTGAAREDSSRSSKVAFSIDLSWRLILVARVGPKYERASEHQVEEEEGKRDPSALGARDEKSLELQRRQALGFQYIQYKLPNHRCGS